MGSTQGGEETAPSAISAEPGMQGGVYSGRGGDSTLSYQCRTRYAGWGLLREGRQHPQLSVLNQVCRVGSTQGGEETAPSAFSAEPGMQGGVYSGRGGSTLSYQCRTRYAGWGLLREGRGWRQHPVLSVQNQVCRVGSTQGGEGLETAPSAISAEPGMQGGVYSGRGGGIQHPQLSVLNQVYSLLRSTVRTYRTSGGTGSA